MTARSEHEAWVDTYRLLEAHYVPHSPSNPDHCAVTGISEGVLGIGQRYRRMLPHEKELELAMRDRLRDVVGRWCISQWSDGAGKPAVLAAVAECVRQTAPEPAWPRLDVETTRAVMV